MAEPNTILPPTYAPAYSSHPDEEPLEGRLIAAIARVLGLKRESISLLDSFLELGGEEDAALRLQKVCVDAGMAVKANDILRCQTVAELQTCVTPCARPPSYFDCSEPIMIAPLEVRKAKRSRPRQSSGSSGSSNNRPETELEEVLSRHSLVSHVTETNPKAGLLEGKRVVFLTLHSIKPVPDNAADINLVSPPQMLIASTQIATLKGFVERSLTEVSLPDIWVVLKAMPLTETGDVNRRHLRTWAQNINEDTYRQVMRLASQCVLEGPSTDMERSVQRAVSKVLQVPQDQIGVNFTFSQLGIDEISAIELVARCRQESVYITADEALQDATLAELAHTASQRRWNEESSDYFELSAMQRLYFLTSLGGDIRRRTMSKAGYRFNQSHLLRITKPCMADDIQAAIEAVVGQHAMLRCRFLNQDGKWSQRILPEVTGSYAFSHHTVSSDDEVKAVIERSQATIDIQKGPVFGVDYLQTNDGQQMIYLIAHHLAVDLPSWRIIIHDLDELLDSGSLLSQRSRPYRKWIELHKVASLEFGTDASLLPNALLNQSYWEMKDVPNSYEDAVETSFSLNSELTSLLQGTCNHVFQTDAADIYLACLMLSFAQTFTDRAVPLVWIQEPGRANLTPEADFAETVGWFTSLNPLINKVSSQDNIVEVLRRLKDNRRSSSVSGTLQFASKLYDWGNEAAFPLDDHFEIVFSYAGCLDNLQRKNGILEQVAIPGRTLASRTSDVGPTVGRIAAFEVTTMVEEGIAKVNFVYNRYSKHQERISSWISNFEHLLLESISRLRYHAQELTLSDVPYLDITYGGLNKLNKSCIDTLKLSSVRDVEAVYPVTASQQRILICQAQRPESNIIRSIVEFVTPTGEMIDTSRLCLAWQLVAARHAALRTVFQESVTETGLYDQIVLRKVFPDMLFIDTVPPDNPIDELSSLPSIDMMDAKPAHRLTLCETPIKTLLSLEISAAICDAASVDILLRDLWHAYSTQRPIPGSVRFSYPDYIEMLKTTRQGRSLKYWTDLLATIRPCMFPSLSSRTVDGPSSHIHVELEVTSKELATRARSQGVSNEAIVRLAWALVLRSFVGDNDACFGCATSGRERFVDGLSEAVGSFGSTVPFAVRLLPLETVASKLRVVDEQLKSSLLHQFVAIPEIEHALALKGGTHLFNTWLSYAEEWPGLNRDFSASGGLDFKPVSQQHCTSYDISLHVRHLNGKLVLDASSRILPEKQAFNVANAFGVAIQAIISSADSSIRDISLFSDRDYAQIVAWGNDRTDDSGQRDVTVVHDLVARHAIQNPGSQAICAWDGDFSYQQMVDAATTLAHYLVDLGVGPHAVVPLVLEKSRWAPVAMLAVLKTGAAFVPIDVEELDSVQFISEQLDAKVAITAEAGRAVLGNIFGKVIVLNDSLFLQMPQYNESLPSIATPDDTACILFPPTSAKDKRGIAFTHEALSIAFLAQGPAVRITAKSRVMQVSSFSSDIALSEIFTTLAHGGCVCIPSSIQRLQNYTEDVQRMQVNWSYMTPFLSRKLDPTLLPTLKVVCFRTCCLDEDTYSAWAGKANVVLAYGDPGVCPLGISFLNVVGPSDLKSIGRPIAGKFWIVNPEDRRKLMPVGQIGELVIEGPTLGSDYSCQDLGRNSFEKLEVHGGPKKYVKTGHHRVRYLEEGTMQFVSSKPDDFEIDGHTVNRTEIEMHIRRCLGHGVDVTVETIEFPGAKDVPVLVAFIGLGERLLTGRDDLVNPSPAIRETLHMVKQLVESGLKNIVAPYCIPSVIIPVKNLPPTLEVDREGLKQLVHGLSREQLEGLAIAPHSTTVHAIGLKPLPLTHAEETVRGILARVLSVDPAVIGSDDGFFDIGGDEVLAAKLVVACRHEGLTLSIADILRNATLTALCRSMTTTDDSTLPELYSPVEPVQATSQQRGSTTEAFIENVLAPKLGVERKAMKEVADTSAMQTRYIESGMLRGRANIDYFTFAFLGPIDGVRLEEACQMLPIIHPILRTAFTPNNRRVYQAAMKSFSVEFERHSCPSWKLPSMTKKAISKDQMAPIAFNKPMTKFMYLDGGKQSTLILRLSKAQYDDLSIALLVKDLKRLYDNTDNPPRRPSYCDFIKSIKNSNCDDTQRYWQTLLEGATMTQVVEHGKPFRLTTRVKTVRQNLLVGSLSNLGISFETVLKSAWAMVLATLSASSDVVFGEIIDGRHVRLQGGHSVLSVMGPTINTIPVRIRFPDTPLSPLELLQYVHGQRIAGISFENMGFLEIVERCTPWPYWTRLSTVVQHQDAETAIIPGEPKTFHLGSTPCIFDVVESKAKDVYDIFVRSTTRGQGKIELGLTFSTDRIPEDLADYALRLLCDSVNMFTSGSIMLSIIPSAHQYRAMQKRIPLPPRPTSSGEPSTATAPMPEIEERTLSSFLPPDQARVIQTVISTAWKVILNPRDLGVPDEHIHRAAFYDLWGSLIPAAQLAAQLNRTLPKLGLPGLDQSAPIVSMEEIIDHPTMHTQFELVAAKMATGQAKPLLQKSHGRSVSMPETGPHGHTAKKPSGSVSSAATVVKNLRRLASTVTRSSGPPPTVPETAAVPIPATPQPDFRATTISPLTPAPQLPRLPTFSLVAPDVFTVAPVDVGPAQPNGASSNMSSARSMTTGSTASSEEGESADVLGPLRSEVAGRVRLQTRGLRRGAEGVEDMVSPLSAASGRSGRFWEGLGADGGEKGEKGRGSAGSRGLLGRIGVAGGRGVG
ncbi:non-ribosomal peptide synthetase [Coniochaeta ligniaria NRRL 30616]|uniref:Non-ribosomal peptide synthetase n=1 Tax=Coniochaeta ligniaria NRRL 30616 TaxID=1408157 RepID=A0A1J7JDT7_9PEZI|nr:non-ribosomal peptide synthetase [Coniochaeta ligniaria NRRL 30616]